MNQKIKIMRPPPKLSDDEIRSYMDFQNVLKKQNEIALKRTLTRWISGIFIVATLTFVGYRLAEPSKTLEKSKAMNEESAERSMQYDSEMIVSDSTEVKSDSANPVNEKRTEITPDKNEAPRKKTSEPVQAGDGSPDKINEAENARIEGDVYLQAEPSEGYDRLYDYFHERLRYPQEAVKDSLQGVVVVVFVIKADGSADNIEVRSKLGEPFTKEVIQLIEAMPPWKPASLNGKPVPSRITLPLTFQIERFKN